MNLVFSENAWEDYLYWYHNDKKILKRVHQLIAETQRNPRNGIGKPEPLKHSLAGYFSRRINDEHRLVYKFDKVNLYIAQLRYHY